MTDQQHPETLREQVDRNAQMRGDTVWLISPETGEEVSFAQVHVFGGLKRQIFIIVTDFRAER